MAARADVAVADEWGRLLAHTEQAGTAIDGIDALIAATGRVTVCRS
jgi:predicted nucleic acid-binding protein